MAGHPRRDFRYDVMRIEPDGSQWIVGQKLKEGSASRLLLALFRRIPNKDYIVVPHAWNNPPHDVPPPNLSARLI